MDGLSRAKIIQNLDTMRIEYGRRCAELMELKKNIEAHERFVQAAECTQTHAQRVRRASENQLLTKLRDAGPEGSSIAELIGSLKMCRATVYNTLKELKKYGEVWQRENGNWMICKPDATTADNGTNAPEGAATEPQAN